MNKFVTVHGHRCQGGGAAALSGCLWVVSSRKRGWWLGQWQVSCHGVVRMAVLQCPHIGIVRASATEMEDGGGGGYACPERVGGLGNSTSFHV